MTSSQDALRKYIIEKMKEGAFAGLTAPIDLLKNAALEVVADAPAALGEILGNGAGALIASKAGDIARDMAKRGVFAVLGEFRDTVTKMKDNLDMQYQRGVERQRQKR